MTDAVHHHVFTGAVLFQNVLQNDITPTLFENTCHDDSVKNKGGSASVNEMGNRVILEDAEIVYAQLQHTC